MYVCVKIKHAGNVIDYTSTPAAATAAAEKKMPEKLYRVIGNVLI